MKALKEKRISLRSLWRRGLVILSLFALVFASCGDSSSGSSSSEPSGGPRVISFSIKQGPTNNQYMGQEVDLTGMVLDVKYADGQRKDVKYEDAKSNITTNPRVVSGWWYYEPQNRWDFGEYDLILSGVPADKPLTFNDENGFYPDGPEVYPIITATWADYYNTKYWDWFKIEGVQSLGLNVTGSANLTKNYYVDDEWFDFAGLTLEADYLINYGELEETVFKRIREHRMPTGIMVVTPEVKPLPVKFSDVTWEIRPRYDRDTYNPKDPSNSKADAYDGYVFITVGEAYRYSRFGWDAGEGVSKLVPIGKVYTVKEIRLDADADTLAKAQRYFFWEENTRESWIDRFGKDAKLHVTYTDGGPGKDLYLQDLKDVMRIYLNSNPAQGFFDDWTDEGVYEGEQDFDIMTLKYPFNKKSKELGVRLYYRGAMAKVDVHVYTGLVKVDTQPTIRFWPDPKWDNDLDNGPGGPKHLADELKVTATYRAVDDASDVWEVELMYFWGDTDWDAERGLWVYTKDRSRRAYGEGPYYVFSSNKDLDDEDEEEQVIQGEAPTTESPESTYVKGYQKYRNNLIKNKLETTTNVTIRHWVNIFTDEAAATETTPFIPASGITIYYEKLFRDRYNKWMDDNGYTYSAYYDEWYKQDKGNWYYFDGWYDHYYGMLPNAWSPYNQNMTKAPYTDNRWVQLTTYNDRGEIIGRDWMNKLISVPDRNFGPKLSQTKKYKLAVTWTATP